MFGRLLLVELAPRRLLIELASPLVELAAPVVKQGVQVRRITIKIAELALVLVAIRVHKGGSSTMCSSTEKDRFVK